jgi:hypothetical protein
MELIFSDDLDRERFGIQPKKPVPHACEPCQRPHVRQCRKPHATEARDQMMFNAGRFAAGATDKVAVEAYKELMNELGE